MIALHNIIRFLWSSVRTFMLIVGFCLALSFAQGAHSQTIIRVDGPNGVDDPPGFGNGWGSNAYRDLQDALVRADDIHVSSPTEEVQIWVRGATGSGIKYKPDQGDNYTPGTRSHNFGLRNHVAIYGGFDTGATSLAQRQPSVYITILTGDLSNNDTTSIVSGVPTFTNYTENSYNVLTGSELTSTCILDGVTISGGNADGSGTQNTGGAIYVRHAENIVRNCNIEFNKSTWLAGGVMYEEATNPEFRNCRFYANKADNRGGGANIGGDVTFVNTTFDTNYSGLQGGGAYLAGGLEFNLINCRLQSNRALGGGGLFVSGGSSQLATYHNCLITGNRAESSVLGLGGGIYNSTKMAMTGCTISANYAQLNGRGIYHDLFDFSGVSSSIVNSIVWGNTGTGDQIRDVEDNLSVSYTDVDGGWSGAGGVGNIDEPPDFINAGAGDFRLQCGSLCMNAGDDTEVAIDTFDVNEDTDFGENTPDLDLGTRIIGTDVDMGAYENQEPQEGPCPGDLTNNDTVDVDDLLVLINSWGPCPAPCVADIDGSLSPCAGNGEVDVDDLLVLINNWGGCSASEPEEMPVHVFDCFDYCDQYTGAHWEGCMNACVIRACHFHPEECD